MTFSGYGHPVNPPFSGYGYPVNPPRTDVFGERVPPRSSQDDEADDITADRDVIPARKSEDG